MKFKIASLIALLSLAGLFFMDFSSIEEKKEHAAKQLAEFASYFEKAKGDVIIRTVKSWFLPGEAFAKPSKKRPVRASRDKAGTEGPSQLTLLKHFPVSGWSFKRNVKHTLTYTLNNNQDVIGTVLMSNVPRDIAKMRKVDFFKSKEAEKNEQLELLGIKNWKGEKYEINPVKSKGGGLHVKVLGSYSRILPSGKSKKYFFKEEHFYFNRKAYHFVVVSPARFSGKQQEQVQDFFKQVSNHFRLI